MEMIWPLVWRKTYDDLIFSFRKSVGRHLKQQEQIITLNRDIDMLKGGIKELTLSLVKTRNDLDLTLDEVIELEKHQIYYDPVHRRMVKRAQ